MAKHGPYVMLALAALGMPWCLHRVFLDTPIEAEMGTAQKIFYFHVPMAWVCLLMAIVCGVAAGFELRRGSDRANAIATAAGEMTVLTGIGVLTTGPIWGDATWGTPWTGDARQTSVALLWLIFVAYVIVKRYGPANSGRLAAALAIIGAINVPLIYYAVRIWKTTHPSNTVAQTLPPEMRMTLYPCLLVLLLASIALVMIRARLERQTLALDELWVQAENQGART